MTFADIAVWILRAFGVLWTIGALFLLRQLYFNSKLDPMIDALEKMTAEFSGDEGAPPEPDDKGREHWMLAGALLTLASGVAMLIAHRAAVPILAALIIQQVLYFIRQRRRELVAKTAAQAEHERPTKETVNGFYTSLGMAALAAWLYSEGALI